MAPSLGHFVNANNLSFSQRGLRQSIVLPINGLVSQQSPRNTLFDCKSPQLVHRSSYQWTGSPFCQIPNLTSSSLAHAFRPVSGNFYLFLAQPVVHSKEWTTSSRLPPRFGPFFPGFLTSQWFTLQSGPLAHDFRPVSDPFYRVPAQPVVHSPKWTTSSRISPRFGPFCPVSNLASGQLQRVDHWLRDSALYVTLSPYQKAPVLRTGTILPRLLALGGI